jgi:hypothetical protein
MTPHQQVIFTCHVILCHVIVTVSTSPSADVIRATCHPSSGDTCHLRIGPSVRQNVQICLPRVTTRGCHMSPVWTCHVSSVRTCHVSVHTSLYGLHSQQFFFFFACLTFRTECDIFSIRTPFDKVNIPPESGRRDRRNGTGFIAF